MLLRQYLPLDSLPSWLRLNGIVGHGISFQKLDGDSNTDKGNAIVATEDLSNDEDSHVKVLLEVPSDLILSLEAVHTYAKADRDLREVLEAASEFGRTARGSILIFLLLQLTHNDPEIPRPIGVSSPWAEYVKFLPPSFPLPTCYSDEEQQLLIGTSLAAAVEAKFDSLQREFDLLREATCGISWCEELWWNENTGRLTMADWIYVDAAYRSRMLDLPGSGHSMVPCIDMVNHMAGSAVKALYETDSDGNAILQLRLGKTLHTGEEVTISYGDEKPAAEMIFSYGFLDSDTTEAKKITLDIDITAATTDPLAFAKKTLCRNIPGLRVSTAYNSEKDILKSLTTSGETTWDSPFMWWASVNEEDGLSIGVVQTMDGRRELEATWKGEKVETPHDLLGLIATHPSRDIFQLRALVLVLDRLETEISRMQETEYELKKFCENNERLDQIWRPEIFSLVSRLRQMEGLLLQKAMNDLTERKNELMESNTVIKYLSQQSQADEVEVEDFT
ncbi:hypothetical protein N7495_002424 [Penicillium taxi]|uniref:uncharacterized protein n=1 Tax=Penicillium taxi TaxID=168475 RepID=UPI0025452AAE|nr:uncharacterized protein N7495_002424 [Penicillium taxi]KAJ5901896.1 hypothetical protein N7495_002424 [Penicillium taxi]